MCGRTEVASERNSRGAGAAGAGADPDRDPVASDARETRRDPVSSVSPVTVEADRGGTRVFDYLTSS